MKIFISASVFLWALLIGVVLSAHANTRVALVVGNSQYSNSSSLPNTLNDAADITKALERLKFDVHHATDLDFATMRRALRDFGKAADQAEMAVIYYAGHGIEIDRRNYLVPVDARLETDFDVGFEAVPLNMVMEAVNRAKGLKLVLLDACRNNPFISNMKSSSRSIGRGLARVEPTAGTLVGFAAKEGTTASDGAGRNSPYTSALLAHMEKPGLEVDLMFRLVRDQVINASGGQQEPFTYGSLPGKEIYLVPPQKPTPVANKFDPGELEIELTYWRSVKDSKRVSLVKSYLAQYPNGQFASLARLMVADMERDASKAIPKTNSNEFAIWNAIKDSDHLQAFEQFAKQFPNGIFAQQANFRAATLREAQQAALAIEKAKKQEAAEAQSVVESLRLAKFAADKIRRLEVIRSAEAETKARDVENARLAKIAADEEVRAEAAKKAEAKRRTQQVEDNRLAKIAVEKKAREAEAVRLAKIVAAKAKRVENVRIASEAKEAREREAARIAEIAIKAKEQKLASLAPAYLEDDELNSGPPLLEGKDLVKKVQSELERLGCSPGKADGLWGRRSQNSLRIFAKLAKTKLAEFKPSMGVIDVLARYSERVCPLKCGIKFEAKAGKCVAKRCANNKTLDRRGRCVLKPDQLKEAKRSVEKSNSSARAKATNRPSPKAEKTAKVAKSCPYESVAVCYKRLSSMSGAELAKMKIWDTEKHQLERICSAWRSRGRRC